MKLKEQNTNSINISMPCLSASDLFLLWQREVVSLLTTTDAPIEGQVGDMTMAFREALGLEEESERISSTRQLLDEEQMLIAEIQQSKQRVRDSARLRHESKLTAQRDAIPMESATAGNPSAFGLDLSTLGRMADSNVDREISEFQERVNEQLRTARTLQRHCLDVVEKPPSRVERAIMGMDLSMLRNDQSQIATLLNDSSVRATPPSRHARSFQFSPSPAAKEHERQLEESPEETEEEQPSSKRTEQALFVDPSDPPLVQHFIQTTPGQKQAQATSKSVQHDNRRRRGQKTPRNDSTPKSQQKSKVARSKLTKTPTALTSELPFSFASAGLF